MSNARRKTLLVVLLLLSAAAGLVGIIKATVPIGRPPSAEGTAEEEAEASPPREITTAAGVEMVLIPGGEFVMGSDAEIDAEPVHKVSVTSFYMDRYEVTQEIYEKISGENPAREKSGKNPVERVRWSDAIRFSNARSVKEGLQPCYDLKTARCNFDADGYRLPTEAEWEYACRAGTRGNYYYGNDARSLKAQAWFKGNAARRHHPVGRRRPNGFGLYDMLGNVREWCNDWYQVDYYRRSPAADPRGPAKADKKLLRGGAWSGSAGSCCSWARYCDDPGFTDACVAGDDYGFRCVRRVMQDASR